MSLRNKRKFRSKEVRFGTRARGQLHCSHRGISHPVITAAVLRTGTVHVLLLPPVLTCPSSTAPLRPTSHGLPWSLQTEHKLLSGQEPSSLADSQPRGSAEIPDAWFHMGNLGLKGFELAAVICPAHSSELVFESWGFSFISKSGLCLCQDILRLTKFS